MTTEPSVSKGRNNGRNHVNAWFLPFNYGANFLKILFRGSPRLSARKKNKAARRNRRTGAGYGCMRRKSRYPCRISDAATASTVFLCFFCFLPEACKIACASMVVRRSSQ